MNNKLFIRLLFVLLCIPAAHQIDAAESVGTNHHGKIATGFGAFKKKLAKYGSIPRDQAMFLWHWGNKKINRKPTTPEDDARAKKIVAVVGISTVIVLGLIILLYGYRNFSKKHPFAIQLALEKVGKNRTDIDHFLHAFERNDIKTMERYPAFKSMVDTYAFNPVHFAITLNYPEKVKILVNRNPALLDDQNSLKETPLHTALRSANFEIALYLIDKIQTDYQIYTMPDHLGRTPLEIAIDNRPIHTEIIDLLIKKGSGAVDMLIEELKVSIANNRKEGLKEIGELIKNVPQLKDKLEELTAAQETQHQK